MYILANGRLITRDPSNGYIKDGGVVIDGTKIKEVGETAALRAKYPEAEFIDAKGGVIMPASSMHIRISIPHWRAAFPSRAITPTTSTTCSTASGGRSTAS